MDTKIQPKWYQLSGIEDFISYLLQTNLVLEKLYQVSGVIGL